MEQQKHFNFGQLAAITLCVIALFGVIYFKNALRFGGPNNSDPAAAPLTYKQLFDQASAQLDPAPPAQVLGASTQTNQPAQPQPLKIR